ncbi:MAG: ABC transporter ATP-binding protein [Nanoarchaeota archaeon]|jgi:ABC-2 type transport system ATP-binding protein|nr:ABC transporter ATP-binding protein [Nanoarchaeota archaeon]
MDDKLIEFKQVSKSFGKNNVLDKIDLFIPENKITGIIGASGEGKSTILKLITSFYKPDSGTVYYFRRDIMSDLKNIKKSFGISIEEGSFYGELTVEENLIHFGGLYGVKGHILYRRTDGVIKFVGLYDARKVFARNLSLGMKKRLDLACALIHKPTVLVLDEPTADLDPLLREQMLHLIKKLNSHGTTVILTTQLLEEIDNVCDNIAVLFEEHIIEQGTMKEIQQKYNSKNMNEVFKKIFSRRNRKTYLESMDKKTEAQSKKKLKIDEHELIAGEPLIDSIFKRNKK